MSVVKTVEPTTEPVTLAEVKAHCKVDVSDDDSLLTAMISAARIAAEQATGRTVITSTYRLTLDAFPDGEIVLPFPSVQSVTSVKYYDANGAQQTLTGGDYVVDLDGGRVDTLAAWPATQERPNAVEVIYVAGWADAAAVPAAVKQWVLMRVASMYENRADYATAREAASVAIPFVDSLLDPYRVWAV